MFLAFDIILKRDEEGTSPPDPVPRYILLHMTTGLSLDSGNLGCLEMYQFQAVKTF